MNLTDMRRYATDDEVDVVVVGTGAGAAPLMARLAREGLSVVAIEAGSNTAPGEHVADETEAAVDINWMQERLSSGFDPTAFGQNNSGRGVGGATLHWGAYCPRPDERDLRLASTTGEGVDWPIGHAELTGYIERVERYLSIAGPSDYPWDPSRRYPQPPVARNASSDLMVAGCEALGIRVADAPVGLVTRDTEQEHWGTRPACASCGGCHQGCRTGAKVSMDTSYLPDAVAHGAEIRPDSTVHSIETDAAGRVTAVVYRSHGVDVRQRCARLVVAGGGIETPRLLLATGLANSSGQVGRNFQAHGARQVWGVFETETRSHRGYPSSMITEDFLRPGDADFAGGYLIQSLGAMPLTMATTLVRGGGLRGRDLVAAMDGYRFMAGVGINAECLPSDDNVLVLSDEVDEIGMPKAHVSFSAGDNEKALDAHAERTMTAIIEAAGATRTLSLQRTAHTIGTCRMGTDPSQAVVDPDGRSFDIPNLWIADNSVYPSSVPANPALTIMALGLRTAERMLAA